MRNLIPIALVVVGPCINMLPAHAVSSAQHQCDVQWDKCNTNSSKCLNGDRCMQRCDQKWMSCSNASATHGSRGQPGKATFPTGTRTGGPPTSTLPAANPPKPGGTLRAGGLNTRGR
jgi:hypothetical protein